MTDRPMRRTATATHGSYTGLKCPACTVVVQGCIDHRGHLSERLGLERHWVVCHPGHPVDPGYLLPDAPDPWPPMDSL